MSKLTSRTREHYESLLPDLESGYVEYRWRSHPLQRLHYRQTRRTLRRALEDHVWSGSSILEVGCGPGTWTDECLRFAGRLTLLDISTSMLREASARYRGDDRVSVVCGDFTSGAVDRPRSFDAIVTVRAFEYMDPKSGVIRRIGRLLKPGGVLVLVTKNPAWRDAKADKGFDDENGEGIHSDWISWSELGDLVGEHGMTVEGVRPAAMGSYESPLSNPVGRRACHLLHRVAVGFPMSRRLDPLTESYLLVARKEHGSGGQ